MDWLKPGPGKILLDGTLGFGGHSRLWLEKSMPDGKVVGCDRDAETLGAARRALQSFGDRAMMHQMNYRDFEGALSAAGIESVDAVLLDLGVNSAQLDRAERGFSFRFDGPLDMRMDPSAGFPASDLVNHASESALADIFFRFGEERFSRQIAKRIVETRRKAPIMTTKGLEDVVFHAVPKKTRFGRIHPATRVFQALRIAVNDELSSLESFIPKAAARLKCDGRMAIISFHSLEDRIVKNQFKGLESQGMIKVLTKKPVLPGEEEIGRNPRARSAKMRVLQRAEGANQ